MVHLGIISAKDASGGAEMRMDRERKACRYLERGTPDGSLPARVVDYADLK